MGIVAADNEGRRHRSEKEECEEKGENQRRTKQEERRKGRKKISD
jgi:acyl-CoA hydrolase